MKIFRYHARYYRNGPEDPKLLFVPYAHYPCTRKSGKPLKVKRIWTGPLVLKGKRTKRQWMNKKNFYGQHVLYYNHVTRRTLIAKRKMILLTEDEHVRWIEVKQSNRYNNQGARQ